MPTDDEWKMHVKESADRDAQLSEHALILQGSIQDIVSMMAALKRSVDVLASSDARLRASQQLALNPLPLDGSITQQNLHALSAADAEIAVRTLSFWKARPAVVVGFVGAAIALAIGFGAPITKEQGGLAVGFTFALLAFLADMRGQRTTSTLVRAGERRGAIAGPDSQRPGPGP